MGFLDRMVTGLVRQSTGINAGSFVRTVGGKNILLLGGAAIAGAVVADKLKKSGQGPSAAPPGGSPPLPTPPSGSPPPLPGAEAPPLPPLPTAAASEAPPPLPETATESDPAEELPQEFVYAVVRTMVAGALSDGTLSDAEKELIEGRLGESGLSPEQTAQVRKDLVIPPTPETLAALVSSQEDRELLYRFGVLIVVADQNASEYENAWLDRVAAALELGEARQKEIRAEVFSASG